ncbi:MAG: DUF1295 domain-containing protein [Myxococcota bacterium]
MARTSKANALIVITYAVAIAASLGVAWWLRDSMPVWATVLIADIVGTTVVFAFSRVFDNSSFYDAYWSVAPPVIAFGLVLGVAGSEPSSVRQGLVCLLVTAWGARLTYNWWRGWKGLAHEDWRYVNLRKTTGGWYWAVSYLGLHMFPTVLVYLGCLAMLPALVDGTQPVSWLDGVAFGFTGLAIFIEARADRELHDFVATKPAPHEVLTTGLWGRCRHPNYLGEMMLWWGLSMFALASDASAWWVLVGPVSITLLFVFISIPMIDKRMLAKRPAYADIVRRYPKFLPLGPRA